MLSRIKLLNNTTTTPPKQPAWYSLLSPPPRLKTQRFLYLTDRSGKSSPVLPPLTPTTPLLATQLRLSTQWPHSLAGGRARTGQDGLAVTGMFMPRGLADCRLTLKVSQCLACSRESRSGRATVLRAPINHSNDLSANLS